MGAKGEVGVPSHPQKLRLTIKFQRRATKHDLWVEPRLVGVRRQQRHRRLVRSEDKLVSGCPFLDRRQGSREARAEERDVTIGVAEIQVISVGGLDLENLRTVGDEEVEEDWA